MVLRLNSNRDHLPVGCGGKDLGFLPSLALKKRLW